MGADPPGLSAADPRTADWPGHAGGSPALACGRGRHTRFLHGRGHPVTAVDRDTRSVEDFGADGRVEVIGWDLERGAPFPLAGRRFAAVVVTNYLHRPLLADLMTAVADGGVLVYEKYSRGQERFGRPSNPAFLLEPGELLEAVRGRLRVLAYEDVVDSRPAAVQRAGEITFEPGGAHPGRVLGHVHTKQDIHGRRRGQGLRSAQLSPVNCLPR